MTENGSGSRLAGIWEKVFTVNGAVAFVGVAAFVVGFLVSALLVRIVCGLIVALSGVYFFSWRRAQWNGEADAPRGGPGRDKQSGDSRMKKLLFDDYQSPAEKYVVREVEEMGPTVVPSSKSAQPVMTSLRKDVAREMEIPDFFDLDSDVPYTETEPKSEFHSLVNKVLLVLKDVLFAHSVAFFWANREKHQIVLESMATDSTQFTSTKRFALENDLVSQVATSGKPQILGRVNPSSERELLCYYESTAYVKSVMGVPVFYMDKARGILPVGVIVADSKAEDAFGQETLELLGRFTKLVSALIKSYTDKYDLLLDSELLSSIRRMQDRIKSLPEEQTVLDALADEAHRLANWDYLTIATYADEQQGWRLQKVVNRSGQDYVTPDQLVDIDGSIVGTVIATNRVATVADLGAEDRYRFHSSERLEHSGSFVCIPVSSMNRCYGALTLESKAAGHFSGSEVETMYRLVENAASVLEVLYMNALVKDFVVVDQLTGSLTKKFFLKKIEEEVRRSEDSGTELACVSIAIDSMEEHTSRYGREGCDIILNETVKLLRAYIRPYDAVGRIDHDRLGVLLINTAASDAYLWAEKMRKLISSHVMTLGKRSFSITFSAGVCGLSQGMRSEELVAGTSQVLDKAMEHGGNLVRVY